jgi:hypothetical protein
MRFAEQVFACRKDARAEIAFRRPMALARRR